MPSSKQQITRANMLGGANMTERPHLVSDQEWIRSHNVKAVNSYIEQVPHKVLLATGAFPDTVLTFIAIPTTVRGETVLIALSETCASRLRPILSSGNQTITTEAMSLKQSKF